MPYRYLEGITTADVCFEARAESFERLIVDAGDALMNVMVEQLESIAVKERRHIVLEDEREDMLLFQALQDLIFFKDARQWLLRFDAVHIERNDNRLLLSAQALGEEIDRERHHMNVDVKAVTLHRFSVERADSEWRAVVVLDV